MKNPLSSLVTWAQRADGWFNTLTGLGTDRDKTTAGAYFGDLQITDPELTDLYNGDAIARKIVTVVPRECLRQGFKVVSKDAAAADGVASDCKRLTVGEIFTEAQIWANLYGGCLVFVGADDGQDPATPLQEDNIRKPVHFLQVYDRRYAVPASYYQDPAHPKYDQPEIYRLTSLSGRISLVHETRLIRFNGAHTDPQTRKVLLYWDLSTLQVVYSTIRQFWDDHKAASYLMTDASQGVFKIRGLLRAIAAGDIKDLQTRAILMDQSRSVARAIMVDAEEGEEFTKVPTQFAGIPDMLDRSANLLSAVTEIPVTILMGQAPAGLNATGESDVRIFYDRIQSERQNRTKPRLERLFTIMAKARKSQASVEAAFPSLWQETPKEKAEREKLEADRDVALIGADVATPDQVAVRWGYEPQIQAPDPSIKPKDIPGAHGPPKAPPVPAKPLSPGGATPAAPAAPAPAPAAPAQG